MANTKRAAQTIATRYLIAGRVQGVGFRYFAEHWANLLGVRGYVRNRWDGSVEVYAVADAVVLQEFKSHLAEGPRSARVTGITESEEAVNDCSTGFTIEGGW
jgi:acylphosphatase